MELRLSAGSEGEARGIGELSVCRSKEEPNEVQKRTYIYVSVQSGN